LLYLFREFLNNLSEPRAFGRRDPFQLESFVFNPKIIQHQSYGFGPFFCFYITILVMAVSDVSAHDQHAIGPFRQGIDHQIRMDHSGTHHPDDP